MKKLSRIMTIVVVVAFVLAVVAAGAARFAIPRFAQASAREKEQEGVRMLQRVFELEQGYYGRYHVYTADLQSLGVRDSGTRWYSVRVSDARPERLCLEAEPSPAEGEGIAPRPMSMRADGFLFQQSGCTGEVDIRRSVPTSISP